MANLRSTAPTLEGFIVDTRKLLIVWEGGSEAFPVPTVGPVTIGRSSACTIRVDHPSVSRQHVRIDFSPNRAPLISDMGSANGTFVNGKKLVPHVFVPLSHGEVVEAGALVIKVPVPAVLREVPKPPPSSVPSMDSKRWIKLVQVAAAAQCHVLVSGETGVGKTWIAEQVHARSRHRDYPLRKLAAGSLSPLLSELSAQEHGTLVLLEIAELSERAQIALLHRLDHTPGDLRIIATSSADLSDLVAQGRFHRDLAARLAGITINVPALRLRRDEIVPLAKKFLPPHLSLGLDAVAQLRGYDWPGNVRELRLAMDRAASTCTGPLIDAASLPFVPLGKALRDDLAAVERESIATALARCGGNQSMAARLLGISRRALLTKMTTHDLRR